MYGQHGSQPTGRSLTADRVDELRAAIRSSELTVVYQPIVDVGDDLVIGAEALVRWPHPVRGVVLPDEFISLAEQSGLIGMLGERVLRQACQDATSWQLPRCQQAKVAVNVSGQQLHDPGFVEVVTQSLTDSGLHPWRLVLEVTESTMAGDDEVATRALRQLRKLGVQVAIDDFGTGYSNLSRLSSMPVDVLKLDRSFVVQLEFSSRARALLRGLIGMAAALGLRAVVEGIETPQQARIVAAMGADEGQGWLWGRPVSSSELRLAELPPTG